MEEAFPHLVHSGKTPMPIGSGKSHVCIIICRATTKETTQGDTLRNAINKSRWNPKNVQVTHRKARREKQRKNKNRKGMLKWQT